MVGLAGFSRCFFIRFGSHRTASTSIFGFEGLVRNTRFVCSIDNAQDGFEGQWKSSASVDVEKEMPGIEMNRDCLNFEYDT